MIQPKFYISEGGYPVFYTEPEYEMLWELGSCTKDYIDEIIHELERIHRGESGEYYFGRERYGITCNGQSCAISDDFENIPLKTVPFEDIYSLMKLWKAYYEEWERKKSNS